MKFFDKILKAGLMLVVGCVAVACGDSEEVDNPVNKVTSIELKASATTITADGVSEVVFTVKGNDESTLTNESVITCTTDQSVVRGAKFTTETAGSYTFVATYNGLTSNEVNITATEVEGPEPPKGENTWVTTDVKTPIKYAEGQYFGTSTSVGIEVVRLGVNQLRFICTPGEEVKSYRVQYYSVSWLYNQLLEKMKQEGKSELTTADADEVLRTFMLNFDYEYLCGELMTSADDSLGENFGYYEFDWTAMDHMMPWPIQSDADYLIVTLASFDEECTNPDNMADMAVCHVHTPEVELVGDPQVIIDVTPSYSSYKVTYTPNADCKYMYFLSNEAAQLDEYIDIYGDKMYRDFLRHYGGRVELDEPYYMKTNATTILPDLMYAATAIALDVNGNPAKTINRKDFTLTEKPAERALGEATVTNIFAGAAIMKFDIEMDANTYCIYQNIYKKKDAEAYMALDDEDPVKKAFIQKLSLEGWGRENQNYRFDKEANLPCGSGYVSEDEKWMDLQSETEYAILYITQNGYGDLSLLKMSEPFITKKLIRDHPEMTKGVDFKFTLSAVGVQALKYEFEYDTDQVAQFYFGDYEPVFDDEKGGYTDINGTHWQWPTPGVNRDVWLYWLLDYRDPDFGIPWSNAWSTPGTNGYSELTLPGMTPGTTYKYACVFETWDGYVSDVIFAEATTEALTFGPNPEVTAELVTSEDGQSFVLKLTGNDDVGGMRYMSLDTSDGTSAQQLYLNYLLKKTPAITLDDYIAAARKSLVGVGFGTPGNSLVKSFTKASLDTADLTVFLCMGFGRNEDGSDAYSDLIYLVYTKDTGTFRTIEEYLAE